MRIIVNGQEKQFPDDISLDGVIEAEGDPPAAVLVEINGVFLPAKKYPSCQLCDGDRVEIILPAFGG